MQTDRNLNAIDLNTLLAWIAISTLLLLACAALARLTWQFIPADDAAAPAAPTTVSTTKPQTATTNFAGLAELRLFGQVAEPSQQIAPPPPPVASKPPPALSLTGIYYSSDVARRHVMAGNAQGKEITYKEGDSVGAGYTVVEIGVDYIAIGDRNGVYKVALHDDHLIAAAQH